VIGTPPKTPGSSERVASIGRLVGPALFVLLWVVPTGSLTGNAKTVAAVVVWMAVWWVTEAAPLAVTSLLPLVLFPLLGVRPVSAVAPNYGDDMVFLFLGGFVLALAVERSGLHRRLALRILTGLGTSARRLVWAFLLVTAALSMWLSNTATTLMMLPIAAGVVEHTAAKKSATRIFLAVAYGASIGGLATLIGTPTNVVLAGMAPVLVAGLPTLTFGGWMLFGLPLVAGLLPIAGLLLGRGLPRTDEGAARAALRDERDALGRLSSTERRTAVLFALTALAWVTRSKMTLGALTLPGWSLLLPDPRLVSDAVPAIVAAIAAAILPAGGGTRRPLVTWSEIHEGVPWGILLLFGGGFALADGVHAAGLDNWLAAELQGLSVLPLSALILVVCLVSMAATELTSNTATATLLMPIMAALASSLGQPPYLLMVPAAVSCSCAFMLPVATPPNAIVMGSGHVSARDLFLEGVRLNVASALLITLLVLTLGRLVLPM
jgi:solute carrier family 13 (sodium-dependent dicarboxylate transporter), member 2/3/5